MKDFSPDVCDCLPPCTTRQPEAGLIEYGRYKFVDELASKIDIDTKQISAAVIYLLDDKETDNEEIAVYAWAQFLSDVGGSAGLVLGLSFATIFGMIDFFFTFLCTLIRRFLSHIGKKLTGIIKARMYAWKYPDSCNCDELVTDQSNLNGS